MIAIPTRSVAKLLLAIFVIFSLATFTACSSSSSDSDSDHEHENEEEHEHDDEMEHEHEDEHLRIPNEGASISIASPENGATFLEDDDVVVTVETDQFALGEEGNHWHVYVDGTSWGMVVGGRLEETLGGLEPGERMIEVYLTTGTHEELKAGDSITITIE
jgi:ABC-type Zn2+ transport system substrate-binding protein/surface adhesin